MVCHSPNIYQSLIPKTGGPFYAHLFSTVIVSVVSVLVFSDAALQATALACVFIPSYCLSDSNNLFTCQKASPVMVHFG